MLRGIVHYGLHFLAPYFLAFLWGRSRQFKAYLILLATMLVDLDHLLAQPIFDPNRCSVGFHLLHSYPMIVLYALLCILPLSYGDGLARLLPLAIAYSPSYQRA